MEHLIKIEPADEWRVYAIEWLPDVINWYVDGKKVKRLRERDLACTPECKAPQVRYTPVPNNYADLLMNFWIPNDTVQRSFGGKKKLSVYPLKAQYDWVRYYQYDEQPPVTWQDRVAKPSAEE